MSPRRHARIALAVTALLVCAGPAAAGEAHLYLAPYATASSLGGEAQWSSSSAGTVFDLEDTLGIEGDENIWGVEGFVRFAGSRLEFGYCTGDYGGSETLGEDVVFNGTTFPSGGKVRSEIEMTRYKLMYGFDLSFKVVNVGFLVGAHLVDIDASLDAAAGADEEGDLRVPVPAIGATLGILPMARLAIHAEVSGFHATVSGVEATLIDGFAGVDFLFVPKVGISGGYRYFVLDASDEDEEDGVDITQRGPYAALVLHL